MKYNYISLFTGAGGLDIGLDQAGLHAISTCEIEKAFCDTLKANQGWRHCDNHNYLRDTKIVNADIREIGHKDLYSGNGLDLVVGGPPCQAFSSSGKQLSVLDPRGALVAEFCRLVDLLKPKMFLFENVRGIVTARDRRGEPGGVITELIHILEDVGYSCRASLLNSADYGAFQRRVRCFIVGSRKGEAPSPPSPSYQKDASLFGKPWKSLQSFLSLHADTDENNYTYPTSQLAKELKHIPSGSGIKSPGKIESTRPGGHWGYRQGTFIADLSLPARTVTGSVSQDWVRWDEVLRRLTFNEVKQLQGFPKDWIVSGTKSQQFKQIGNAVPAVFGKLIGDCIVEHLKNFPTNMPIKIGIPDSFKSYMEYTRKDHERNKSARKIHLNFENSESQTEL